MTKAMPQAIYAGTYYQLFGHFLTETVPNLAAVAELAKNSPNVPILMHSSPKMRDDTAELPKPTSWVEWALDKLGIEFDRLKFITEPLEIKELLIPPSPFRRKFRYSSDTLPDLLDKFFTAPAGVDEKVYFSRTRWPKPRLTHEDQIEERLSSIGYTIVHPQELSLDEQLSVIRGAKTLVGPQGTALHWSLFSPRIEQVVSLGWPSPLQKGICLVRGQEYREIRGRKTKDGGLRVRTVSVDHLEQVLKHTAV